MFHFHFAHPCWLLSHTYCGQTELRWLLSIEFDTTKMHIFQIRNLFHCVVESWWNMPFKGTRHGDGVVHGAVAMLLQLWKHAATLWHHAAWIRIVTSHNAWMGYEYSLPKLRTPSKQWGMCDKYMKRTIISMYATRLPRLLLFSTPSVYSLSNEYHTCFTAHNIKSQTCLSHVHWMLSGSIRVIWNWFNRPKGVFLVSYWWRGGER